MANIPVPDLSGTQNYSGFGTDQVYWSMPVQYAAPSPTPNLAVVATGGGLAPQTPPDQIIQVDPQQATYLDLYATLTPEGVPARGWLPGTYMHTAGAMPRGA